MKGFSIACGLIKWTSAEDPLLNSSLKQMDLRSQMTYPYGTTYAPLWWYTNGVKQAGPVAEALLIDLIKKGQVHPAFSFGATPFQIGCP